VHWNVARNKPAWQSRIEICVHVVLKPMTIRLSKIKEADSCAPETILMKNSLLACLFGYCTQCSWERSNSLGLVVLTEVQHFHKQESVSTCKYKNEANTYHDTFMKRRLHMRNVAFTLNIWQIRENNIRNLYLKTTKIRPYKAISQLRRTCELSSANPSALDSKCCT